MGIFGSDNSLEPVRSTARKEQRDEEPPIRAATAAELAGAMQRRDRPEPQEPVRSVATKAPAQPAEADAVAKQHGLYTADKGATRVYFTDYQQKSEVMRATAGKITTKLDDRQTVTAMLDLAKERGWDTVKLRGTADFKREAWQQAQQRGIAAEGYAPTQTDLQEAARRKIAAAPAAPKASETVPIKAAATASAKVKPSLSTPEVVQAAGKQRVEIASGWTAKEAGAMHARIEARPCGRI